ncbi:hypothetical protein ARMA_2234 [Ardenticatena maritima]|uniref:HD-GYP domain-containing protein n=1 Tax=Ardenticatena maritima TaxID=872965 RepID=A0A0M8K9U2_9CHLR|nr:GAF domain-containing protein [Ardenticatena maritima]GAP63811.1 hypothetical protein ARMA_2234 [Ardenticatena maritima]
MSAQTPAYHLLCINIHTWRDLLPATHHTTSSTTQETHPFDAILFAPTNQADLARLPLLRALAPVIVLVEHKMLDIALAALQLGASAYLVREYTTTDLLDAVIEQVVRQAGTSTPLDQVPGIVWATDENGIITAIHGDAQTMLGQDKHRLLGQPFNTLLENLQSHATETTKPKPQWQQVVQTFFVEGKDTVLELYYHPHQKTSAPHGGAGFLIDATPAREHKQALNRKYQELSLLQHIMDKSYTLDSIPVLLETICTELAQVLHVPQAAAALLDRHKQELRVVAEYREPGRPSGLGAVIPLEENEATRYVLEHQRPLAIKDAQNDPRTRGTHHLMRYRGTVSLLIVPLIAHGQTLGTIGLDSLKEREFTEDEIHLVMRIARATAQAIENAQLYEAERHARMRAERLQHATSQFTQQQTIEDVANVLIENLAMLLETPRISLWLWSGGRPRRLHTLNAEHHSLSEELIEEIQARFAESASPFSIETERNPRWRSLLANDANTLLLLPLRTKESVFGSVLVETECVPDPETRALLTAITQQAALAFQTTQSYEQTRLWAEKTQELARISLDLRNANTQDDLANRLLPHLMSFANAEAASLLLFDPVRRIYRTAYALGKWEHLRGWELPEHFGANAHVIATGQPFVSDDITQSTIFKAVERMNGCHAVIGLPLRLADRVLGTVWLGRTSPFDTAILPHLSTLAELAALALDRAALHQETQTRLRRLATLHDIDTTINASVDIRLTFDLVLGYLLDELAMDAAVTMRLVNTMNELTPIAARGFRYADAIRHVRIGEGLAGRVAMERRRLVLNNLTESGISMHSEFIHKERFQTFIGIPLIAKGRLKGVLEIFARYVFNPSEEWLAFVETIAARLALALDNFELFDELQRSNTELRLAYDATIEGWSRALELRDIETKGHADRVTKLTMQLVQQMNIPVEEWVHIRRGALLHDIGKLGIPDSILFKPGPLTDEEWEIMRKHPVYAYEMLSSISYLRPALDIPYYHHEKWDGTGYPRGLKGKEIPLPARIFAVVDVYDALTSDRPYRPAWSHEKALAYIRAESGRHFDPMVVQAFDHLMRTLHQGKKRGDS